MGLVAGFVLAGNRRVLLATLAITISVTYTLIAAATVTGLREAQTTLAEDLEAPKTLVVRADFAAFDPAQLPRPPDAALAVVESAGTEFYVIRAGPGALDNASFAYLGRSSGYAAGAKFSLAGIDRIVREPPAIAGISPDWVGVDETAFRTLGGPVAPLVHVAAYARLESHEERAVRMAGFETLRAPATQAFYEGGTHQLVSAVWTTVLASTAVVGVVTSGFLLLELHALQRSFATIRLFAGAGLVARLLFLRAAALLALGHAIAILGSAALLYFLEAAGVFSFALPWGHVSRAAAVTFGGGLVGTLPALARLRRPLQAEHIRGGSYRPGTPRALRLTLGSWRNLLPLGAAATILTATLGVVFGTLGIPDQVFGQFQGERVISTTDSGNPLRGTVSSFAGLHLDEVDGFEAASPEIFVPTSLRGRPVVVRGVSWTDFESLEKPTIASGQPPTAARDAVIGARLARVLDVRVGDTLVVPAAYEPSATAVRIAGVAKVDGILQDELFVSLSTARSLTGLRATDVNLIRVRLEPGVGSIEIKTITPPQRIEVVDLRITPDRPVPNETATAAVGLVNFATTNQERTLTLRVNGVVQTEFVVSMPPQSTRTERVAFRVPPASALSVEINPRVDVQPGDSAYVVEAPDLAPLGSPLAIRLIDRQGQPAADVAVELVSATGTTDADGRATLVPDTIGNHTILAQGPAGRAARAILVLAPEDVDRHHLRIREIEGPSEIQAGPWKGTATFENVGGKRFLGPVTLYWNGNESQFPAVAIDAGRSSRVEVTFDLPVGFHRIGDANYTYTVAAVAPSDAPAPPPPNGADSPQPAVTLEDFLELRRGQLGTGSAPAPDPVEAFLGASSRNLDAAVTLVVLATALHAGLIVFVTVQRAVEERARNVGTLAVVGADRRALRRIALREYGVLGIVAAVSGTALGLALTRAATYFSVVNGFGHSLEPRIDLGFTFRLATVSAITILAAAVIAVENARSRNLRLLLEEGPSRRERPDLDRLLEGQP